MPAILFKFRYLIIIIFSLLLLLMQGCKKKESTPRQETYQQYFEENVLNKEYIVEFASDNGSVITSLYSGYIFKLYKNTLTNGPMTGVKNGTTTSGTWTSNDDYSNLIIILNQPSIPTELTFMNRQWRFTKKAFPVMELAPWDTSDPDILYMRRL